MSISQLTIFGAGLIGGSIAQGARSAGAADRIVALDREAPRKGEADPLFDAWVQVDDEPERLHEELTRSTLTVLCTPVRSIMDWLPEVLDITPGWVTDCGSTKQAILNHVADHPSRHHFIAGHPMAGHPQGGLENARIDLFQGRKWILCPEGSDPNGVDLVRAFVSSLGAQVLLLDAVEHDRSVAQTSHLPQVVASLLSVQASSRNALQAAGPGFASATRVAGGAESMWRDIFETNGGPIGRAMQDLGRQLVQLGSELESQGPQATLDVLARARALRDKS